MIQPSGRLVIAVAGGAAAAMLVGVAAPGLWLLPLLWTAALLTAAAVDARLAARRTGTPRLHAAAAVAVVETFDLSVTVPSFGPGQNGQAAEIAITADPLLRLETDGRIPLPSGSFARITATALRRGTAHLTRLDLRWQGPLGLVWRRSRTIIDRAIVITPDLRPIRSDGVAILARDSRAGLMVQRQSGAGGEFNALADYQPGMDRRRIDWKQSARHGGLYAKEFHTERDNNIVLAFDCGRTMTEPLAGLPRLDRAITAGLLTAYVSLKMGDRVTLFGFDARVRQVSPAYSGPGSFAAIKRAAALLDYSPEETNFTLALSTLGQRLDRRSLVMIFTDFVDATSAELMLRSVGRLLEKHLVICVVMHDEELETLVAAEPGDADDIARAVIAAAMLRERRIVLTRLRRMGIDVLEASWRDLGPALAQRYLDTKRRQTL